MTYLEFKEKVKSLIRDDDPSDEMAAQAGGEYVKSKIAREVDKDLLLSKSYMDSYKASRFNLLGYVSSFNDAEYNAAVRDYLTVDADRAGIEAFLAAQIKNARQDQEGLGPTVDSLIRQGVLDLMSHIDNYRVLRRTCFHAADAVAVGNACRIRLPDDGAIQDIWYTTIIEALIPGSYEPDELVLSNGRVYKVIVGGDITEEEIGTGLTTNSQTGVVQSTCDCNSVGILQPEENLGAIRFRYLGEEFEFRKPVQSYPWSQRVDLEVTPIERANRLPPSGAIDPVGYSMYLWPKLDDKHVYEMAWTGIYFDFNDGDIITLDEMAAQAVADYVRGHLLKMMDDRLGATFAAQSYLGQRALLFANGREKRAVKYNG